MEAASRLRGGTMTALVVGHADARGSDSANQAVARARASAVASHLHQLGVPPALVTVDARAAEEPVASNESATGRARNRRVDVTLVPGSEGQAPR